MRDTWVNQYWSMQLPDWKKNIDLAHDSAIEYSAYFNEQQEWKRKFCNKQTLNYNAFQLHAIAFTWTHCSSVLPKDSTEKVVLTIYRFIESSRLHSAEKFEGAKTPTGRGERSAADNRTKAIVSCIKFVTGSRNRAVKWIENKIRHLLAKYS